MRVLDALWFSPNILHFAASKLPFKLHGTPFIGIVLVEFEAGDDEGEPGQHGAYIGSALGDKQEEDVQGILENGAKVHPVHAAALWVHMKKEII